MPIWQLCANLLIPNCLRSNLSYSPLAALELYVNRPMPKSYTCHPADKTKDLTKVRALTSKERSYIQTFPESFNFIGAKTDIEQAIGNAVPVKMAEYIGTTIFNYMRIHD